MSSSTTAASTSSSLRIFSSTWNVAAFPSSNVTQHPALADMLVHSHGTNLPDVYAIGLQEIVPLNAVNILISANETQVALESWSELILNMLNANSNGTRFSLLAHIAVVGTALCVFVGEKNIFNQTINRNTVLTSSLNLGQFYTGNKAAVAIRARIGDRTVCFVSVHFAAHRGTESAITRTEHMTYTVQQLAFYGCIESNTMKSQLQQKQTGQQQQQNMNHERIDQALLSSDQTLRNAPKQVEICSLNVGDHDLCVLLGDLNSRMIQNIDQSEIWKVVNEWDGNAAGENVNHEKACQKMSAWDELWNEPMASTLHNLRFKEGAVTFAPTYKIQPGTSKYHIPNQSKPKKIFNHCPAWCDRILYSVRSGISCKQLKYFSAPIFYSDHLPVYAVFDLGQKDEIEQGEHKSTSTLLNRENEARLKSLKFVQIRKSSNYGMCGGTPNDECTVM